MFTARINIQILFSAVVGYLFVFYGPQQERCIEQCFSTAGPLPGTGPWHQLYRTARGSPGICNFSFLRIFHVFYSGNILRKIIFVNVSKSSDPDVGLRKLKYATRFH